MKLFEFCCMNDSAAWHKAAEENNMTLCSCTYGMLSDPKGRQNALTDLMTAAEQEPTVLLFSNRGMDDGIGNFLAALPADLVLIPVGSDAMLANRGTVSASHITKVNQYLTFGGEENIRGMFTYLRYYLFEDSTAPVPPEPVYTPFDGIYGTDDNRIYQDPEIFLQEEGQNFSCRIGMISHRSFWLNHSLHTEFALIRALNRLEIGVIPVFCAGEKSDLVQSYDFAEICEHYFSKDGKLLIDGLINLQMHLIKGKNGMSVAETSGFFFEQLGIPVFHPIASYFTDFEKWQNSSNPLAQELQTDYLNPEMAGMTEPVLVSVRDTDRQNYLPLPENVNAFAERIKKWINLRIRPNREKKLALMLHNDVCSGVEATIGKAFGLNVFDSVAALMHRLQAEGYQIDNIPENGTALRELILQKKAISDFRWTHVEDIIACGGCLYQMPVHDEYMTYLNEFAPAMRQKMVDSWGNPPGEGMVMGDNLIITGLRFGSLLVMVQPKRGCYGAKCTGEVCRILHDPNCPPAHQYIASYRYLERVEKVDAVIHMGTDGSLEYLPGKASGLGQECWPYAVLGALPNIYPYHLGVTSEAAIAKRRTNAVLIGYYPACSSGLDEADLSLMDRLNSYEEAADLENGQESVLKEELLQQLQNRPSLMKLLTATEDFAEGVRQVRASLLRCSEGRKKMRLHTFGKNPDEEEAVRYICELLQGDGFWEKDPEESEFDCQCRIYAFVKQALRENSPDPLCLDIRRTYALLMHTCEEEDWLIHALNGGYIPASQGGMPDENGRNILPAGHNFYMMNMDKVPTPEAYERGKILADQLLTSYQKDEGAYPKKIAMNMISLDISRTHGEQLSQFLNLLGVRPEWDKKGRVTGLAVIPSEELGRPRIDITLRISGVMRDTWPDAVRLLDDAVLLISSLDESEEDNYLLANIHEMERECGEMGERAKTIRIFGDPPGAFGAGIDLALKASAWESDKDLARYFIQSSAFAYGNGLEGRKSIREFVQNAKNIDLTCDITSSRRMDTLSCGFGLHVHGGFKLLAETIGKRKIHQYQSISELNSPSATTSLKEQVEQDISQTLLNAAWRDEQMKEEYTGAAEMMRRIQTVFETKCTSDTVSDAVLNQLADTYVNDGDMREWLLSRNPYAAEEIGRRFLELQSRGKWNPDEEMLQKLQENYLSLEGYMEDGMSSSGEIQGGNVEIVRDDQVENWKKNLKDIDDYLSQLE